MKVTYNWLKDFVEVKISAQKLAHKLTMAGLEVTNLEERDNDFVFEFEITPNRPDCLSVIGIAREVAAITGKKIKLDYPKSKHRLCGTKNAKFEIKVESKKDCPFYTATIIKGIQVKPSPDWLKKRLELVGARSINNIVDITNYLLLETGQPLHAFDLDKIKDGAIFVRRAGDSEKITTIDGEERNLNKQILIIADREKPIAIAGIMGGQYSEVSERSKDILLESAVFDSIITRQASRKLGLSSESSYRFERGIDWQNTDAVARRAANLIIEIAAGELMLSKATSRPKAKQKAIVLKPAEVNRILGRNYSSAEINKIFGSLSFSLKKQKKAGLKINPPSFRIDIHQPIDLVEEVARVSGYENIPVRLPRMLIQDTRVSSLWDKRKAVKDILIGQGLNEAVTYSLIGRGLAAQCGYSKAQLIGIVNPLTNQQEILRPGLIPGLVSCIAYNLNQKQRDIRIFETGDIFIGNQERHFLGLAWSNKGFDLLPLKRILELLPLKKTLESLLKRLGIMDFEFIKPDGAQPCLQKQACLSLVLNKKICANLGMVKPEILNALDIKDPICVAELDLEMLFAQIDKAEKKYTPIPLYPEVMRDISVVLKQDVFLGDVIKRIKARGIPYFIELKLKDYYLDKPIPADSKGLTLSCIYRSDDHTLTAQEIDNSHQEILDILKSDFSAQQR